MTTRKFLAAVRLNKRGFALGFLTATVITLGIGYTQKDRYAYRFAELSRSVIGDENTARLESVYFSLQDQFDQLRYDVLGGDTNPFSDTDSAAVLTPATPTPAPTPATEEDPPPADVVIQPISDAPAPMPLPETQLLLASPSDGEGVWTTAGLPLSSPDDVLMAKTFIRPDAERPYAVAGILLVDHRRVDLNIIGGVDNPGGDLGVHGPGVIPEEDRTTLVAAWNGGFRGPHGGFGMYADERQYRPLRDGFASVAVMRDGSIQMGTWGTDLTWSDDMVAVRQNAIMLVENCEVSPRTSEGNGTWG